MENLKEDSKSKESADFWSNKTVHIIVWVLLVLFFIVNTAGLFGISAVLFYTLLIIGGLLAIFEIINLSKSNFKRIIKVILIVIAVILFSYWPTYLLQTYPLVLSSSCELLGGDYHSSYIGRSIISAKSKHCSFKKTSDYNKSCTSSDQCEGRCVTYVGFERFVLSGSPEVKFHCSEYKYGYDSNLSPSIFTEYTIEEY